MKNGTFDVKAHIGGDASSVATDSPCPLKDKCPYYKDVKENPEKLGKCPVAGACPHANKKEKAEAGGDYKAAAAKCPHMAAAQAKKAEATAEDVKVDL